MFKILFEKAKLKKVDLNLMVLEIGHQRFLFKQSLRILTRKAQPKIKLKRLRRMNMDI